MNHSHLNNITGELDVGLAIIAPDGREGMLQHARELAGSAFRSCSTRPGTAYVFR